MAGVVAIRQFVGMATQADVRRLALALPGTQEEQGHFAFGIRKQGKIKGYAWVWKERVVEKKPRVPNPGVLAVRVSSLAEKDIMISAEPTKFFTEPHYNGFPAVLVRLAAVRPGASAAAGWVALPGAAGGGRGQGQDRQASYRPGGDEGGQAAVETLGGRQDADTFPPIIAGQAHPRSTRPVDAHAHRGRRSPWHRAMACRVRCGGDSTAPGALAGPCRACRGHHAHHRQRPSTCRSVREDAGTPARDSHRAAHARGAAHDPPVAHAAAAGRVGRGHVPPVGAIGGFAGRT